MTTRRPTADHIDTARALARYHADQVQQHEREAGNAIMGIVLAILVACCLTWLLLAWADCTASGAAMCLMTMTPTRPGLWQRLCRAVRRYWRAWHIRWAEQDIRYLEEDVEAAQQWLYAAPDVIAYRRALLDDLRVRDMVDRG